MSKNKELRGVSEISHGLDEYASLLGKPRQGVAAEKFNPQNAAKSIKKNKIPKTDAQIKQIESSIQNIFLFDSLSKDEIKEMMDYMFSKPVKTSEVIIKENDPGDNFYIIEKGIFEAYKNDKLMKKYTNSGYFGELALMYNTPRNATVKALSDGQLWGLDRDSFRRIVLQTAYERRNKFDVIVKNIPFMNSLPESDKLKLLDGLSCGTFNDTVIFKEGAKNERFFIIETGQVEVSKKNVVKKTLKSGEFFGEECILFNRPSSFTAKCKGEVSLGYVEKESFMYIFNSILKATKDNCEAFLKQLN